MSWAAFSTGSGISGSTKGDGPVTALVLHGGPGLSDYTETLALEVLSAGAGGVRVARYQQRGLAPSIIEGPYTLDQYIEDFTDVVDHLEADRVLLVGHSWGGWLALQAAVRRPARVSGLLLVDSMGGVGDGGLGKVDGVIASRLSPSAVEKILSLREVDLTPIERGTRRIRLAWPGYFADPDDAPSAPDIVCDLAVNEPLMTEARVMLASGELERALPAIAVPSVHVIALQSPIDPNANEATAKLMPNAVVEHVDSGHFPWIERPGSITSATRRLLAVI